MERKTMGKQIRYAVCDETPFRLKVGLGHNTVILIGKPCFRFADEKC